MQSDLNSFDVIPFDDIMPGGSVRCVSLDGKQYISIRDLIVCVCEKNPNYSSQIWRNICPEKKEELDQFLEFYKFPGQGQSLQPVITFPGALKLLMFLPGEAAKNHRSAMAVILQRYYAGDNSLVDEIRANAGSNGSVQQMARASLDLFDETEKCIKRARVSLHELGEESSAIHRHVQGAVSGMEQMLHLKEKMYSLDQNERIQQKEHVIAMAHAQVQALQIVAQAQLDKPAVTTTEKNSATIVGCKEWTMNYLRGKGITHPEICESIWIRLQYRLKKRHPNIQLTRKKGLLHFSVSDLEAVQDVIDHGLGHLGWPTSRPQTA